MMQTHTSCCLLQLISLLLFWSNEAFLLSRQSPISSSRFSTFDYEYLPPNPDANPDEIPSKFASSYPRDTPAGLRGEAVRSALKSGRCVGWDLTSDEHLSSGGVLRIQGQGMRDFLNSKLTQDFTTAKLDSTYQEACLLDGKGRVVDRLKVSIVDDETALILTSPGHASQDLLERLAPFVFPLDRIEITNRDEAFTFSLASIQWNDIENSMRAVQAHMKTTCSFSFPTRADQCAVWDWDNDGTKVLVIPSIGMPSQVCVGFTFVFYGNGEQSKITGRRVWDFLIGEANSEGPIGIGALEYETLRIQAGVPAYGQEIGTSTKTSPLELHWQELINMEKGCYLGQEGIASITKNPRGPPRTLYMVIFDDDLNTYETQSRGDKSTLENLTRAPRPGDAIFALGSNEQLNVGTITSVAEANGTGERCIVSLALIRRADSIMKQMKELDLQITREDEDILDVDPFSGVIQPPPLDPLDGLEVIVGGTFTTGKLQMVPSRALRPGRNIFDERITVEDYFEQPPSPEKSSSEQKDKSSAVANVKIDAQKAAEEAKAAAAEAQRKAEKLELLKRRAEEAMARRKQQQKE